MVFWEFLMSRKRKGRLCLLRDLVLLAYADGGLCAEEVEFISRFCRAEGLDLQLIDVLSQMPRKVRDVYPREREDGLRYMGMLVQLALVDGPCCEKEMEYCRVVAGKLGLPLDTPVVMMRMMKSGRWPDAAAVARAYPAVHAGEPE